MIVMAGEGQQHSSPPSPVPGYVSELEGYVYRLRRGRPLLVVPKRWGVLLLTEEGHTVEAGLPSKRYRLSPGRGWSILGGRRRISPA